MTLARNGVITMAVEGELDEAVVRRLIVHVGGIPGESHGKCGKDRLRQRISGYNNAARYAPGMVLVDLDDDFDCAPPLRCSWLPSGKAANLCFRIAVRAVEAWLLADAQGLAKFFGVARSRFPSKPELVDDPKGELVNLARSSRRREIRDDLVPRPEGRRKVGPAYSSRLIEFIDNYWQVDGAAARANSLMRAIRCLGQLVDTP